MHHENAQLRGSLTDTQCNLSNLQTILITMKKECEEAIQLEIGDLEETLDIDEVSGTSERVKPTITTSQQQKMKMKDLDEFLSNTQSDNIINVCDTHTKNLFNNCSLTDIDDTNKNSNDNQNVCTNIIFYVCARIYDYFFCFVVFLKSACEFKWYN